MRFQAVTQIILVVLSLVIIFTLVRPMFADIRTDQDEIARFRQALDTVGQYNARLSELQQQVRSFNPEDIEALETYVPATVDTLAVSRDIQRIAGMNQVTVESIVPILSESGDTSVRAAEDPGMETIDPETGMPVEGGNLGSLTAEAGAGLQAHQFAFAGFGTYEQLTAMLADFERNIYPLRLIKLTFAAEAESTVYGISAVLETYALPLE